MKLGEFEYYAKTGDILLFKSMDKCADLQRLYTCDSYDHVGIIYKENNKFNYRACAIIINDNKILALKDEVSPYY